MICGFFLPVFHYDHHSKTDLVYIVLAIYTYLFYFGLAQQEIAPGTYTTNTCLFFKWSNFASQKQSTNQLFRRAVIKKKGHSYRISLSNNEPEKRQVIIVGPQK